MKTSCIIVDDEPLALDKMEVFIKRIPFLELKKRCTSGFEAMEYLRNNKIDILFLDIQMDDISGIQLLEALPSKPITIFTTAYDEYAIKGYELDICDYLLKPISYDRFLKSVDKASRQIQKKQDYKANLYHNPSDKEITNNQQFMFVKTEYRMQKVNFEDILYIEGMKDYLRIKTADSNIMTIMTFKKMADLLPTKYYIRIHKSFIIPIHKIESIERNRIKIRDKFIPIGDTYKEAFYNQLKEMGLHF